MRGIHTNVGLVLLVVTISTPACTIGGSAESNAPAAGARHDSGGPGGTVPVTVAKAVERPVPLTVQVIGSVEPSSSVSIRAQVTGELTSVTFTEGDDVRQGQVLFTLDQRPLDAALKQAEANLQRDSAQAANAALQARRASELADRGIAPRDQMETARASANALEATLAADRAAVENARVQLQYATVTAPITGRTGALMVHPGNLVRANDTTPLVVINQIAPINVTFSIPEAQLPMLKQYLARGGVQVQAESPSDEEGAAAGRITFVDNAVDPTTGTIRVKGSFPNRDRRLWPGQFVNVVMTLATDPRAIVVPGDAVQQGQQGPFVYIVKPDNTAEMRPVDVGRAVENDTIITSGIAAGETVVTDGQLRLVPGSPIAIKPAGQEPTQ
jgi:membrane fusion protein, multidrug efflux system